MGNIHSKSIPQQYRAILTVSFFIPQFTLFCVAWKLGERCNVLLTYCNHIVLKILWVTKGRVDKSILAGKPSVQPYTFFFKMLIGQREQINVQKGRGFVFFKVGLWLSVSTDSFTYLKIFIWIFCILNQRTQFIMQYCMYFFTIHS